MMTSLQAGEATGEFNCCPWLSSWRRTNSEHPQYEQPALAKVAQPSIPVPNAGDIILRT